MLTYEEIRNAAKLLAQSGDDALIKSVQGRNVKVTGPIPLDDFLFLLHYTKTLRIMEKINVT